MDKDSMDSDIMKDLKEYRKEQTIRKLRNINEVDSDKSDSLCDTHTSKSASSPTKFAVQHTDEFGLGEERMKTFSQHSFRNSHKENISV
jgi:hypothetical protein